MLREKKGGQEEFVTHPARRLAIKHFIGGHVSSTIFSNSTHVWVVEEDGGARTPAGEWTLESTGPRLSMSMSGRVTTFKTASITAAATTPATIATTAAEAATTAVSATRTTAAAAAATTTATEKAIFNQQ